MDREGARSFWWKLKVVWVVLLCVGMAGQAWGQDAKESTAKKRAGSSAKGSTGKSTGKSTAKTTAGSTAGGGARSGHGTEARSGKRKVAGGKSNRAAVSGKRKSRPTKASLAKTKAAQAQSAKLRRAFVASAQLRPMAQQLAATRSPAAYAGVLAYAKANPGEGAAAAYMALGHAYMMDRRYGEAQANFRQAGTLGEALADYADYLGAQAAVQGGRGAEAYVLLDRFAERHPESIFNASAPVMLANAHLQQNDPAGALAVLTPLLGTDVALHVDFRYSLGRAYQMSGDTAHAGAVYREIYQKQPLSYEAVQARQQLQAMGAPLTAAERKAHADQLFEAKHYADAEEEYRSIAKNDSSLSEADRNALEIYEAVCEFRLKRISRREVERLPQTSDDTAALKMYLLAEISRNEGDKESHDAYVAQMVTRFPHSRWLEETLYSGGNMYLLLHDSKQAIYHYTLLVDMFPNSTYAPSAHWRAAWMSYRMRNYPDAARLMEEQIVKYPSGIEVPGALYWRARIYEDEERNLGQAANFYKVLSSTYVDFYYANLARERLKVLEGQAPAAAPVPVLNAVRRPGTPELTAELPEDEPHLIKAKLLANAALNEYIAPEIQAGDSSAEWGALAMGQIYSSYGEYSRALQAMKHSGISFFTLPMDQVPEEYWKLLFPQPYWADLVSNSERNGLDPYLVASLIRQESEFNAGVVSHANAYGLMQLLPSVGKSIAKKQGIRGFNANQLLNPAVNLQLGTANLRQVLDRFGGQPEYALAAYNAGDVPVRQWMATGEYKDIPEFVESIPYTETREYVQAILRNREMYKALYARRVAGAKGGEGR